MYAVFCGSDQVAGKLERGRYMAVLNLFHFHEFSELILLKTWNVSLEIPSDFKHCPWFEVHSVVDLGLFVKSQFFQYFTGVTHWVSQQDIRKNYHRNLPEAFDVCSQMPSNSKKGPVVHKLSELEHIRISNRGDGFQLILSPGSLNQVPLSTLSTSAQKSKFLNNCQIFFKRIRWDFLKLEGEYQLILWKHLPAGLQIRYRHRAFKSSLIFGSASIICTWALFWFVLHHILQDLPWIWKLERSKKR